MTIGKDCGYASAVSTPNSFHGVGAIGGSSQPGLIKSLALTI